MTVMAIRLESGRSIPQVGLGTWKIAPDQAAELVVKAVQSGYRHFDCACDYGNEPEVGEGLQAAMRDGLCRREELWVTSKLWNTFHRRKHVREAIERSLADLQLEYLDLYLIHFPIAMKYVSPDRRYPPGWIHEPEADDPRMELDRVPIAETWGAMEELVDAGRVREIGVSNFGCALLRDLLSYARIRPAVLQVELHPYLTQEKLLRFCREEGIAVTAFSPLGASSYVPLQMAGPHESVLEELLVRDLAERHRRTPAQIVLRWGIQRGTIVVPKTSHAGRLAENIDLGDFALADEEMDAIAQLNRNRRFNDPGEFCETAFGTFCPIYE